jgi:anti-sigma factor RsiW
MTTPDVMNCQTARGALLDDHRGQLDHATSAALHAHLEGCVGCARAEIAERLLSEQLERQLPQHGAPVALKRRLAAQWPAPVAPRAPARRTWWWVGAAAAAVLVVAVLGLMAQLRSGRADRLVGEAVNDHLRILARADRLDVPSGNMHQVKPWLTGQLDFAPVMAFAGDADFPLRGGTVEYFLDRRAAVAVYGRRLHVITLIVARADGLPWPPGPPLVTRAQGFNVRLWRSGELGYALVSDLDAAELAQLASRLGG